MTVKFVDLRKQYLSLEKEIDSVFKSVMEESSFVLGRHVEEFEKNFAAFQRGKHCVGVSSGVSALHMALLAHGIGAGDEVLTVPNSFFATAEAVAYTGARPVFVDIKDRTLLMDAAAMERAITPKTRAIVPVHLYGQMADMREINEIAEKHGLAVIEDACQAHAAESHGKRAGELGTACFSFYPSKNLGAPGDGGAVITTEPEIADKVRLMRSHCENPKGTHNGIGYTERLDGLHAAILNLKLKKLEEWTEARRRVAKQYEERLDGVGIIMPYEEEYNRHVYHLFVVRHPKRDALKEFLEKNSVQTGLHYLKLISSQKPFIGGGRHFPVAEKASSGILSLPMHEWLTDEEVGFVSEKVREFCTRN
ncbi:MAG: DegT/DnrJ/EryC1/StrS family aminotransferase [Candidatus Diapherotrites archaeon]|uniref:DegT/DnrJ/EryC1/StrS family aminotransferase n=1 Tax=Candidatus Iainarchaeum sp. TaxID=3101447 RepID=A0A8T3YJJ4_9ARCH|nr:DegT/DnrJ/EryC1/StrS family aminotransferase [Candidatus Diapherotrites archaeon]